MINPCPVCGKQQIQLFTSVVCSDDECGKRPAKCSRPHGFWLSLHEHDPASRPCSGGTETAYTGYSRLRFDTDWLTSKTQHKLFSFPAGTGGSGTVRYWAICDGPQEDDVVIFYGALTPNLPVGNGITPCVHLYEDYGILANTLSMWTLAQSRKK